MIAGNLKALQREILLSFWKIHILHHASEGPVVGQWMLQELRHHGYEVSPGTLYPILHRMERLGWLRCEVDPSGGPRARRSYYATQVGLEVLKTVQQQLRELRSEVGERLADQEDLR
jgi:PadR family transcriptional regulator, regulatory protein PadR